MISLALTARQQTGNENRSYFTQRSNVFTTEWK